MAFPRYDSYKDSGVEWLGEIPSHWNLQSIRSVTELKSERNRPDLPVLSVYREYGVLLKDSRDDNHNATSLDISNYKSVEVGDLVVNKMKAWQGSMGISEYQGIVSPAYITCRVNVEQIESKFLHYLLRSKVYIGIYNALSYGVRVGQWDMHYEDFKKIPLPLPTVLEQAQISSFLDRITTEIDQAIAKKQRLIELLQEQKAILINQAVTKGLNPNVPMRDSGIEWIGEIPEHWEVKRLKYLLRDTLKYGANEEAKDQNYSNPRYIRITDFGEDGKLRDDTFRSLPMSIAKDYLLEEGDILFARSGATVGKTFLFDCYQGKACFAGYLIKASSDKNKILPRFLYFFTKSQAFESWKDFIFSKSTIQNIGADKYAILQVIKPPICEQEEIINKINSDCYQTDEIICSVLQEIGVLIEFKSLVIANAVTGKLKVCDRAI